MKKEIDPKEKMNKIDIFDNICHKRETAQFQNYRKTGYDTVIADIKKRTIKMSYY